jgi:hypothetical protein
MRFYMLELAQLTLAVSPILSPCEGDFPLTGADFCRRSGILKGSEKLTEK